MSSTNLLLAALASNALPRLTTCTVHRVSEFYDFDSSMRAASLRKADITSYDPRDWAAKESIVSIVHRPRGLQRCST